MARGERFERHNHGEQSERVGLDQEADPCGKPDDVDIDASAVKRRPYSNKNLPGNSG
jgi:hypothetical protein